MKKQRDLGLNLSTRRTRKAQFLDEMEAVVPWRELVALIEAAAPRKPTGRPPFGHETMLRLHFIQQWFGLSDFAMEEALFDVALYREFAGLSNSSRLPDRVSILRFRHLLEEHKLAEQIFATVNATLAAKGLLLKEGTAIDATLIAAPSSTKNQGGERDPEMHQTKKGNQGATRFQCNNWRYANPALARGGVGRSLILLRFLFTFQTCIVTAHQWGSRCRAGTQRFWECVSFPVTSATLK